MPLTSFGQQQANFSRILSLEYLKVLFDSPIARLSTASYQRLSIRTFSQNRCFICFQFSDSFPYFLTDRHAEDALMVLAYK